MKKGWGSPKFIGSSGQNKTDGIGQTRNATQYNGGGNSEAQGSWIVSGVDKIKEVPGLSTRQKEDLTDDVKDVLKHTNACQTKSQEIEIRVDQGIARASVKAEGVNCSEANLKTGLTGPTITSKTDRSSDSINGPVSQEASSKASVGAEAGGSIESSAIRATNADIIMDSDGSSASLTKNIDIASLTAKSKIDLELGTKPKGVVETEIGAHVIKGEVCGEVKSAPFEMFGHEVQPSMKSCVSAGFGAGAGASFGTKTGTTFTGGLGAGVGIQPGVKITDPEQPDLETVAPIDPLDPFATLEEENSCKSDDLLLQEQILGTPGDVDADPIMMDLSSGEENACHLNDPVDAMIEESTVDTDGQVQDYLGNIVDTDGQAQDHLGNIVDTDGQAQDHLSNIVDTDGQAQDHLGNIVDTDGQAQDHLNNIVDTDGQAQDHLGNIVDTDGQAQDHLSNIVDTDGQAQNHLGNIVDTDGQAQDHLSNIVDTDGQAQDHLTSVASTLENCKVLQAQIEQELEAAISNREQTESELETAVANREQTERELELATITREQAERELEAATKAREQAERELETATEAREKAEHEAEIATDNRETAEIAAAEARNYEQEAREHAEAARENEHEAREHAEGAREHEHEARESADSARYEAESAA